MKNDVVFITGFRENFKIVCSKCGSENMSLYSYTDAHAHLECENCGNYWCNSTKPCYFKTKLESIEVD